MNVVTAIKLLHWVDCLWSFVGYPVVALVRWRERVAAASREHELTLARIQAEAQREVLLAFTDSMKSTIQQTTDMAREQTAVLQEWLKGFRTVEMPTSTTVREEDEAAAERERMRVAGFPVESTGLEQMQWLMEKMNEES
jgi:hypothetical protein